MILNKDVPGEVMAGVCRCMILHAGMISLWERGTGAKKLLR